MIAEDVRPLQEEGRATLQIPAYIAQLLRLVDAALRKRLPSHFEFEVQCRNFIARVIISIC